MGHCTEIKSNQIIGWFLQRGQNREKTSRCRVENKQTQPTCYTNSGNRTLGHIGERRVPSPLLPNCSTSIPRQLVPNKFHLQISITVALASAIVV